jgi:hypothetical protein
MERMAQRVVEELLRLFGGHRLDAWVGVVDVLDFLAGMPRTSRGRTLRCRIGQRRARQVDPGRPISGSERPGGPFF